MKEYLLIFPFSKMEEGRVYLHRGFVDPTSDKFRIWVYPHTKHYKVISNWFVYIVNGKAFEHKKMEVIAEWQ